MFYSRMVTLNASWTDVFLVFVAKGCGYISTFTQSHVSKDGRRMRVGVFLLELKLWILKWLAEAQQLTKTIEQNVLDSHISIDRNI